MITPLAKFLDWSAIQIVWGRRLNSQLNLRMNRIVTKMLFGLLLLLNSCATGDPIQARRPADLKMNQHAGRGDLLFVMIRLDDGEKLPFVLDTGSPTTLFDASLKPKLGKRLGSMTTWNFGIKQEADIHVSPKLYLGNTPLMITGSNILTYDFRKMSSASGSEYPTMGILGMDVLEHYCVQLDFEARKVRFLNPHGLKTITLGKPMPLNLSGDDSRVFIKSPGLLGTESNKLLVDTGFQADGASNHERYDQIVQELKLRSVSGCSLFPKCEWNGEAYTNLIILKGEGLIGLRFLARHLVTLDFPNRTMYLKQRHVGPLDNNLETHFTP